MRFTARKTVMALLATLAFVICCATMAHAQSAGTGAIEGTLTDPQGRAVPNATVTATSAATNQERTATTGASGDYKFSLLNPGSYRLRFTAAGFKTTEVSAVQVVTTETATVDKVLEVGAVTQTVTVESSVETLQTSSSTLGTTVTGAAINALPMANGNYTEILSLSAGTNASVDNATALGKGTQDISANGVDPGSNNFQMDGVAVNNIANSGSSNDGTIYTGIPVPSPDAIGEFKVQTSTYDASYGRNPGANVNVTTKSGSNDFHGSAFEYFRNSVLNADDFFYDKTSLAPHQVFDQNQFGATVGGPIKKDKLFFFFSYRGTRSKNAVAPQGGDFGASLFVTPAFDTFFDAKNPEGANGRGSCPTPATLGVAPNTPDFNSISENCSAQAEVFAKAMGISDDNIIGLRMFQLTTGTPKHPTAGGVPYNYYIPSPASDPQFCNDSTGICNFSVPAIYKENQYVANGDYVISSKNTLTTKYFYTHNPQVSFLGQGGGNLPGTPENVLFGNQAAVLKLTTLVTSTFVNEARISYQQNENGAAVAVPPGGCPDADNLPAPYGCGSPNELGMQSEVPNFYEPESFLNVGTGYSMFGGLLPDKGPTNQLQAADQISWSHGRHSIRAGFEYEWTNWPLEDPGLQQGLVLILGANAFLGEASNAVPGGLFDLGCLFCVKSTSGSPNTEGVFHFYQLNNMNSYVLDDFKVSPKLTINVGLRWEYDGQLSDKYGHLTQVWADRMAANETIAACPGPLVSTACDAAGVQQYVVPSNFLNAKYGLPPDGVGFARNKNTLEGHAPYTNFAPRLGFAWQPLGGGKLVVRGGAGIFYDRIGLDRVVHAFEQGYPYAETYDFGSGSPRGAVSSLAVPFAPVALVCVPNDPNCNPPAGQVGNGLGFAPRYADPTTANMSQTGCADYGPGPNCGFQINSGLNTPLLARAIHTPLVQEYSLGFQYEFKPQWVLEVGYVGSKGINLTDYNHNHNGATLFSPCDPVGSTCGTDPYGLCQAAGFDGSATPVCNTVNNASFRTPVLGYEPIGLQESDFNGSSNYNSLQVTARHQFSHGLSMQAAYTWERDLSDIFFSNSADINDALALKTQPSPNGPRHGQWGPVSFDRFQHLVLNYSYDLPFGNKSEGLMKKVINGWNVSGVTIAQSGNPLTFIGNGSGGAYGTNQQLSFQGVTTAEICSGFSNGQLKTGGSLESHTASKFGTSGYFNTAAFGCQAPVVPFGDPGFISPITPFLNIAPATDYGNSAVGIVTGPGQFNWDISIVKNTQLTERVRMQFRSDFYNAFNHPQFAPPQGTNFGSVGFENVGNFTATPTGNQITATSVNPRLIQFGLHFFF